MAIKSSILYLIIILNAVFLMAFKISYTEETSIFINDDYAEVDYNKATTIDITSNDYGITNNISSITISTEPENGSVVVNDDYTITYTPDENYDGSDEFIYKICDNEGNCGQATVTIQVYYIDYKPIAMNDTIETYWSSAKTIYCCSNDSNLLNPPFTLSIESGPEIGNAYCDDTTIIYSPDKGYSGYDSIQYKISDENNDYSYAWIIIKLLDSGASDDFFIPNGFSPNGDGINDTFLVPDFDNITDITLQIFTRLGKIVYQNDDYHNNWDGISNYGVYKGKKLKQGTYYYKFIIPDLDLNRKGYVYINY